MSRVILLSLKKDSSPMSYRYERVQGATKILDMTLENISEELDLLTLSLIDGIQEYVNLTLDQNERFKSGYMDMAKARYVNGQGPLSSCIPTPNSEGFTALAQVQIDPNSNEKELIWSTPGQIYPTLVKTLGLVPSAPIKATSNAFVKVLASCIDRANLIRRINEDSDKLRTLMQKKKQLIKGKEEEE